jgi:hypothetical protein
MRRLYLAALSTSLFVLAGGVSADDAAEKRERQRQHYRDVRSLLDETDIATGSSRTMLRRSPETPCVVTVLITADRLSGGNELTITVDLRQLDLSAVVPGVHESTWQGVDYRTHVLFIEHTKTAGVTVSAVAFREKANGNGLLSAPMKWNKPHVALLPRRALGVLQDKVLSNEADCVNVQRLYNALAEFTSACRPS